MELCDLCVKLRVLCGCAFLVAAVLHWETSKSLHGSRGVAVVT